MKGFFKHKDKTPEAPSGQQQHARKPEAHTTPSDLDDSVDNYVIHGISGERSGEYSILGEERLSIANRFVIARLGEHVQVESVSDKELMIGGSFVQVALVKPGDVIVTDKGEFRFEKIAAGSQKRQHQLRVINTIITLIIVAVVLWSVVSPATSPFGNYLGREALEKDWQVIDHAFDPQVTVPTQSQAKPTEAAQQPERQLDLTPEQTNRLIAEARLRYRVAEQYADESRVLPGNLYWAIEELKALVDSLEGVQPEPPIREQARKRLLQYQHQFKKQLNELEIRYQLAAKLGETQEAELIAQQIMQIANNENSKAYRWAQEQIKNLSDN